MKDRYRYRARHRQVSLDAGNEGSGADFKDRLAESHPNPDESLTASERADAVRRAIASLPEELRTPLILSEYEDLSHSEVGAILKCSAKAVESRLYRARHQLKTLLGWLWDAS